LIIYIYGDNRFKKHIKTILSQSSIEAKIEDIEGIDKLKQTIKSNPKDIFIIDNDKIITTHKLIRKIDIFKPKDGIEKEFLEQYGVGDICFNSMDGFIKYILNRLENTTHTNTTIEEENNSDEDKFDFSNSIDFGQDKENQPTQQEEDIPCQRDRGNIISIEDIYDEEMKEAISELQEKNQKSEG